MKTFEFPEIEIEKFGIADIIANSDSEGTPGSEEDL